jgi:hypothetical protein
MNASLDFIASSKQEDDDDDDETVFTMKCLSKMIPLLPPKKAMLHFGMEKAEKQASRGEKEKRQR